MHNGGYAWAHESLRQEAVEAILAMTRGGLSVHRIRRVCRIGNATSAVVNRVLLDRSTPITVVTARKLIDGCAAWQAMPDPDPIAVKRAAANDAFERWSDAVEAWNDLNATAKLIRQETCKAQGHEWMIRPGSRVDRVCTRCLRYAMGDEPVRRKVAA